MREWKEIKNARKKNVEKKRVNVQMIRKSIIWFESFGDTEKEFHVFLIISSDLGQKDQKGKWYLKTTNHQISKIGVMFFIELVFYK